MKRIAVVIAMYAIFISSLLCGCATPLPAQVSRFPWNQSVEFGGLLFNLNSARTAASFTNWVNQLTTTSDEFAIVDVTMTNKTGNPLPLGLQPVFRLLDASDANYEPDLQHTIMINMGKPGRVSYGQSMNPNTRVRQELVFDVPDVPGKKYVLLVIVPTANASFIYDISPEM